MVKQILFQGPVTQLFKSLIKCHLIFVLSVKFIKKLIFIEIFNLNTELLSVISSLKRYDKKICQLKS